MSPPNDDSTEKEIDPGPGNGPKPSALQDPIAKLLIARANMLVGPQYREQRMFVQFDAWTNPLFLGWLQKHGHLLRGKAKDLFVTRRPRFDIKLLGCGMALLREVPLDRALRRAANEIYGVPVRISEEMAAHLKKNNTTVREVIHELAEYLHRIFSRHFHQNGRKTPSAHLETAFARFASGTLSINPRSQEELNAEPDSANFFIFAEFCIQAACYRAHPGRKWWLALAGLFAALQDVYCLRYLRNGAPRQFAEYSDLFLDPRRPIPDAVLLDHVESVQHRDGNLEKVAERVTWNAFWYFFDDVL